MFKRLPPLVLVAIAAILASASLPAQDSYIVPAVVYTDDDKDRLVDMVAERPALPDIGKVRLIETGQHGDSD